MAIEIIPAVLEHSVEDVRAQLERLSATGGVVQIDLVGKNFLSGEEALPLWEEFDFECDVMLANPAVEVGSLVALGCSRIVVHANGSTAHEALTSLQHLRGGTFATEVGVAIGSTDTPLTLQPFEGLYDYVQVMGIEVIGAQGQPFDARAIELVRALHEVHPSLPIQVDGGVDASNIRTLVDAGAARLVCGHAIFKEADAAGALEVLRRIANE
jgi:ribulose-phosphate 3-epimerase